MSPKELVETALRILTAWTDGRKPASADLNTLKEAFYYAAMSAVGRCDSERASCDGRRIHRARISHGVNSSLHLRQHGVGLRIDPPRQIGPSGLSRVTNSTAAHATLDRHQRCKAPEV